MNIKSIFGEPLDKFENCEYSFETTKCENFGLNLMSNQTAFLKQHLFLLYLCLDSKESTMSPIFLDVSQFFSKNNRLFLHHFEIDNKKIQYVNGETPSIRLSTVILVDTELKLYFWEVKLHDYNSDSSYISIEKIFEINLPQYTNIQSIEINGHNVKQFEIKFQYTTYEAEKAMVINNVDFGCTFYPAHREILFGLNDEDVFYYKTERPFDLNKYTSVDV